jgi:acylphosphatase
MDVGAQLIVKGVVQGVGFRFFVYRHATRLGLAGFCRNLYNADVEIEVEGDRSLVEDLIQQVKVGPRAAHVSDVKVNWAPYQGRFSGFQIR